MSDRDLAEENLLNGETIEKIEVWDSTPEGHATKQFSITLDLGWCERPIASGMYDHDAVGVAHAIANTLGGEVVIRDV